MKESILNKDKIWNRIKKYIYLLIFLIVLLFVLIFILIGLNIKIINKIN